MKSLRIKQMSDRPCNYCSFKTIKSQARADNKTLTTMNNINHGGVDVYVNGEWVCWFMELPNYCCC